MPRRLTQLQLKMIGLMAEGIPRTEIASRLKLDIRRLERWAVRDDVKQAIAEAQTKAIVAMADQISEDCRNSLTRSLPKAIARLIESLDHEDARIRLRAAEAIARWSGFYQPTAIAKPDLAQAEVDFKRYLNVLEHTNGNGSHSAGEPLA